jgi:hypothetical protein
MSERVDSGRARRPTQHWEAACIKRGVPVIERDDFYGDWNYVIKPRADRR